ncbi:MAG: hypothetical protein QM485_12080 [Flavobacteriaceae bacterium]
MFSAVNFQMRYAPYTIAGREIVGKGLLREVYGIEIMLCAYTPWPLWVFFVSIA